tara:strand:- start:2530 stop:3048 length:519 start_codon:yes stop_codon:yes gene_type:complete
MSWEDITKKPKPDYLDVDGDGDTEEQMVDALETVEQVNSSEFTTKKSWQEILKVLTPRMFLENLQTIVEGEIETKRKGTMILRFENGRVEVTQRGRNPTKVSIYNRGDPASKFTAVHDNLSMLLERTIKFLNTPATFEKVAGTVTTSNAPHTTLFSEGRMGGGKNGEDEEEY